jgi:predicted PurR-regulated permease PerM
VRTLGAPLYRRLLKTTRQRQSLAAVATVVIIVVIVILPLALIAVALLREAASVYENIQSGELDSAGIFSKSSTPCLMFVMAEYPTSFYGFTKKSTVKADRVKCS